MPLLLHIGNSLHLVGRQQSGADTADAYTTGHIVGSLAVVARQHDGLYTDLSQFVHHASRFGANHVAEGYQTDALSVRCNEHIGLAFLRELSQGVGYVTCDFHAVIGQEVCFAAKNAHSVDCGPYPFARRHPEVGDGQQVAAVRLHYGLAQRML